MVQSLRRSQTFVENVVVFVMSNNYSTALTVHLVGFCWAKDAFFAGAAAWTVSRARRFISVLALTLVHQLFSSAYFLFVSSYVNELFLNCLRRNRFIFYAEIENKATNILPNPAAI